MTDTSSSPLGHADYDGQTFLNPLGFIAISVLGTATVFLPRRYAVWPMIIMGCFVSPAQRIAIFTLNFDLLRLMVIFGTVRVAFRNEWKGFRWRSMDRMVIAFAVVGAAVYTAHNGTLESAKYKLGWMYDILGMYFLFRCLVRNLDDVSRAAMGFAVISVPVAIAFLIEWSTGRNIFSVFGGVPEITVIRDGRLRCQGAYAHPILAGCYWASVLPLMSALWWRQASERRWAVIGLVCGLTIILLCASSTPVSAVVFGALGAGFFVFRRHMRLVRWIVVAMLVSLHFMMNAPVWHLISRLDFAGGSTGWHRYNLINQFILHLDDWWALGASNVQDWRVFAGDITNQYILEAVRGGIWTMMLFAAVIVVAFANVGRLCRAQQRSKSNLMMSWALGVALFVHCISFVGVSYFGQITMVWYLTLAMIASLSSERRRTPVVRRVSASRAASLAVGRLA